ncbi:MAG TPA: glycosyltransferase family 9 protein [Acidimicrobiales bacterium]
MTAVRAAPVTVDRVAALRALPGLGDLLCLVPALRAVRAAHPAARVTLVGLPGAAWFVDRFPHLCDELLPVAGVEGVPEVAPDPEARAVFARRAGAHRFDLALQLHGSGVTSNAVLDLLGGSRRVVTRPPGDGGRGRGPAAPGAAGPGPGPGEEVVVPYDERLPEIERLLAVTTAAGCPPRGTHLELPVTDGEVAAARTLRRAARGDGTGRPFACLHPGASTYQRAWSVPGFARVGAHLARQGFDVLVTGTAPEADRTAAVVGRLRAALDDPADPDRTGRVVDLAGRTDVGVLGALYRDAALVVSNDTGAAHVAAAVGAPAVVVTAAADPWRWAPLDRQRHRTVTGGGPGEVGWPGAADVLAAVDEQLAPSSPTDAPPTGPAVAR